MKMRDVFGLFAAAVGGALAVALPWWAVNDFRVNDLGYETPLPWPLSDVVICSGAGAACGVFIALLRYGRRHRRATQLANIARTMGLEFQPAVALSDLDAFKTLYVIQRWWAGRNRLSGVVNGVPIDMLDYTYLFNLRGAGSGGSANRFTQTMVLLTTDETVPMFDLRPRTSDDKILGAMLGESSVERITFKGSGGTSDVEPETIDRFEKTYFLAPESRLNVFRERDRQVLAPLQEVRARIAAGDLTGANAIIKQVEQQPVYVLQSGHEEAIRRLFTGGVLRFFAERPGWHIESGGGRLAVWRDRQVMPAAQRPAMLEDALAIRERVLAR